MVKLTHRVIYSDLGCRLYLVNIAETSFDIEYHSLPFERLLWIDLHDLFYWKYHLSLRKRATEKICQASGRKGVSHKDA